MFKLKTTACAVLLTISLGLSAQNNKDRNDWQQLDRYEKSNIEVMANKDNKRRVVFLGNSITDNWAKKRPQFFTDNGFVGRGISGQTSYQMLARFPEDVLKLKPRLLVLNCATNDVAENTHHYDQDRTMRNIIAMTQLAKANCIKVILTSVLPASQFSWNKSVIDGAEKIAALNKAIETYAKKNGIPYVDYYSQLLADDNKSLNPAYTNDGVHPTEAGYEVMESIILPQVRKIVK